MGLNYSLTLRIISIYLLGGIFGKCEQDQAPKCLTEKSDSFSINALLKTIYLLRMLLWNVVLSRVFPLILNVNYFIFSFL